MSLVKTLTDLNRRVPDIDRYEVEEVLPSNVSQTYPKLVEFLKTYYEYLELDEVPAEIINDLKFTRDVIQTEEELLDYIAKELLLGKPYFQSFADKKTALQFSNIFYRSKGSKFAIQQFFRVFYNIDVEVDYGKDFLFLVGDPIQEDLQYRINGREIGRNFKYTQDGNVTVQLKLEGQDKFQTLSIDSDYVIDYADKIVTTVPSENYRNYIDSDGYPADGSTFRIVVDKLDQTLIGSEQQLKRIHDNEFYQFYSLKIISELAINQWEEAYKTFAHPAGMWYGGETAIVSSFTLRLGSNPTSLDAPYRTPITSNTGLRIRTISDITELNTDSSGEIYRSSINDLEKYAEDPISILDTQYAAVGRADLITARTFDDSAADLSNTINTLDEDRYDLTGSGPYNYDYPEP